MFSQLSGGWYCFAVSASSKTDGWVAIAFGSYVLPRWYQKRFSSLGVPSGRATALSTEELLTMADFLSSVVASNVWSREEDEESLGKSSSPVTAGAFGSIFFARAVDIVAFQSTPRPRC